MYKYILSRGLLWIAILICNSAAQALIDDPLPSWNDGSAKKAILDFISTTTNTLDPRFVPKEKRIATFDQDGTLWVEQPQVPQVVFMFDRIRSLAPEHPDWQSLEPFKSILLDDKSAIEKFTKKDLEKIIMASSSEIPVKEFQIAVKDWLSRTNNPRWNRPYTELVYQPMLEVLSLLRSNGYRTYIVTGGGQAFVRAYSDTVYGVTLEHVIGSALDTQYSYNKQGEAILLSSPEILFNDNFAGKAEAIYLFTGANPQAAFGNSTGDQQMLEYAEANNGAHLLMLIHHDDPMREYSYGVNSKIGTFSDELMAEAKKRGWNVVSMKNDWKKIFIFDR